MVGEVCSWWRILTLRWSPPDFNCEAEAGVGGLHPGVRCMIRRVIAWTASPLFSHKLLPFLSLELFYAGVFRFFGWKHQNRSEIISEVTCRQRKQFCVTVSDCIQKMHLYHRKTDLITASLCRKLHRYILPIGINYQYGVFPQWLHSTVKGIPASVSLSKNILSCIKCSYLG